MAGMKKIKGLPEVLKNLNKAIKAQRGATKAGLTEAGLVIKADSVKNTPIDLGNLRGSAFVMVTGLSVDDSGSFSGEDVSELTASYNTAIMEGKAIVGNSQTNLKGIVGYGAYYALFVHEMPSSYNFNSGSNKFLEKAMLKNKDRVLKIIAKHTKV